MDGVRVTLTIITLTGDEYTSGSCFPPPSNDIVIIDNVPCLQFPGLAWDVLVCATDSDCSASGGVGAHLCLCIA